MYKRTLKRSTCTKPKPKFKPGFIVVDGYVGQLSITWKPTVAQAKAYAKELVMNQSFDPQDEENEYILSIFQVGVRTEQNSCDLIEHWELDGWVREREGEEEGGDDAGPQGEFPEDNVIGFDHERRERRAKEEVRVVRIPGEKK